MPPPWGVRVMLMILDADLGPVLRGGIADAGGHGPCRGRGRVGAVELPLQAREKASRLSPAAPRRSRFFETVLIRFSSQSAEAVAVISGRGSKLWRYSWKDSREYRPGHASKPATAKPK